MIPIRKLHDATLIGLEVDWGKSELRCNFDVGVDKKVIVQLLCRGLTYLKCPKMQPWGPSVLVNEVQTDHFPNEIRLNIAMQSGDVIEANVQNLTFE